MIQQLVNAIMQLIFSSFSGAFMFLFFSSFLTVASNSSTDMDMDMDIQFTNGIADSVSDVESITNGIESVPAAAAAAAPPLVMQDMNFLVVTDVHSWVSGHAHNKTLDAGYGDVLSFYENLKGRADAQHKDLFFVMNGDFIDGTGLTSNPPKYLTPILQEMPWDAINIGNHELYKNTTIEFITQPDGFVDQWEGRYLTTNVVLKDGNIPIGDRYRYLHGTFTNQTVLTFGFLYNFQNNCEITTVQEVETVVNEDWFQNILREGDFDAILVLAHMDAFDPLVDVILEKIREICGDNMPVQFITGHSHRRKYNEPDAFSSSFEAGHYLDSIGFASLSFNETNAAFEHKFIDANLNTMKDMLGIPTSASFETATGQALSLLIADTKEALGLNEIVACAPKTYELHNGLEKKDSLWGLFVKEVVPTQLFKESPGMIFLQNPGGFRYNIYQGKMTQDDFTSMNPYNDTLHKVGSGIYGHEFIQAFGEPNYVDGNGYEKELPELVVAGEVIPEKEYEVYTVEFDLKYVKEHLENATNRVFEPIELEGQTTGTLWLGHFRDIWQCPKLADEPGKEKSWQEKFIDFFESFTVVKMIAFISTFIVILLFGWMFLCRHPHSRLPDDDDQSSKDSRFEDYSSDEDSSNMFPVSSKDPSSAFSDTSSYRTISEDHHIV